MATCANAEALRAVSELSRPPICLLKIRLDGQLRLRSHESIEDIWLPGNRSRYRKLKTHTNSKKTIAALYSGLFIP